MIQYLVRTFGAFTSCYSADASTPSSTPSMRASSNITSQADRSPSASRPLHSASPQRPHVPAEVSTGLLSASPPVPPASVGRGTPSYASTAHVSAVTSAASPPAPPASASVGGGPLSYASVASATAAAISRPSTQTLQQRQRAAQRREALQDAIDDMLQSVDLYIRTRKRFDSTSPLSYSIQLHTILSDESLLTEFADLCKKYPEVKKGINDLQSLIESFGEAKFCCTTNSGSMFVSVACLTPLQLESTHRVFGYFSCGNCRNSWTSAASWTNKWQKCKRCESKCYPYEQHELLISEGGHSSGLQPHDTERCEKCIELGRICLPKRYYAISY